LLPIRTDQVCLEKDENVLIKLFPHAGAGRRRRFPFSRLRGACVVLWVDAGHAPRLLQSVRRAGAGDSSDTRVAHRPTPAPWRSTASALVTLDDDPGLRPDAHAFIVDKAPRFTVTDNLPQYPARIPRQNTSHNS